MNNLLESAIELVKSLPESEQEKIALLMIDNLQVSENNNTELNDWDKLSQVLDECQIETGITDLAEQHDHYIHGTPKRAN
ncbi:hypothetical protein ACN4EE_00975 [Geminocystis sp. CENA526]|uniref:hypothetical protein n=1 Tax=Geminocystis sp. CENA526 TaxID=1355871 RepID=UPI003D6F014F